MSSLLLLLESFKNNPTLLYMAVFFVSFLESFAFIGEFVPGAFFIVGSGYLASRGILNIYLTVLLAVFGAVLADIASYFLALKFYKDIKSTPFVKKYDKVMEKGVEFFKKHGGKSVFLGRFVGALRPIVPFVAGVFGMDRKAFFFWAVLSGILWGISYVGIGYFFGNNWQVIRGIFRDIDALIAIIVVSVLAFYLVRRRFNGD